VDARRKDLEAVLGELLQRRAPETVATRYRRLRVLDRWLEEEEEIPASPMARMKPPIAPDQPVPVVPKDGLRRLLGTCTGKDFEARRDTAIVMFLLDTGARRGELADLQLPRPQDGRGAGPLTCASAPGTRTPTFPGSGLAAFCGSWGGHRGPHTVHHDQAAHDRARRRYDGLHAKAASTGFPEEADACRARPSSSMPSTACRRRRIVTRPRPSKVSVTGRTLIPPVADPRW
jgi:hypothetical protein